GAGDVTTPPPPTEESADPDSNGGNAGDRDVDNPRRYFGARACGDGCRPRDALTSAVHDSDGHRVCPRDWVGVRRIRLCATSTVPKIPRVRVRRRPARDGHAERHREG